MIVQHRNEIALYAQNILEGADHRRCDNGGIEHGYYDESSEDTRIRTAPAQLHKKRSGL